jgi:hypothetical protein
MFNPDTLPVSIFMPSFETAARSRKVVPIIAPVHSDVEIETAIIALGREPRGGRRSTAASRAMSLGPRMGFNQPKDRGRKGGGTGRLWQDAQWRLTC